MIRVMRCALHTNNALEIKKRLSLQNKRPIHTADDKVSADPHVFSSDQTASFYASLHNARDYCNREIRAQSVHTFPLTSANCCSAKILSLTIPMSVSVFALLTFLSTHSLSSKSMLIYHQSSFMRARTGFGPGSTSRYASKRKVIVE